MALENLIIKGTFDTPEIDFKNNGNSANLLIKGRSNPDDFREFYGPVLNWIDNYCKNPAKKTEINMQFVYFNTATSKLLLDMFVDFATLREAGHNVAVNWHYKEGAIDMAKAGEEYNDIFDIPFEFYSYKK